MVRPPVKLRQSRKNRAKFLIFIQKLMSGFVLYLLYLQKKVWCGFAKYLYVCVFYYIVCLECYFGSNWILFGNLTLLCHSLSISIGSCLSCVYLGVLSEFYLLFWCCVLNEEMNMCGHMKHNCINYLVYTFSVIAMMFLIVTGRLGLQLLW